MLKTPRLKKSESLEIRLPYPTKLAFMARCRAEGRSASEALRHFIDGHLDGPPARAPGANAAGKLRHLIAGALVAAAVGAVALPSLARPSLRAEFDRLSTDRGAIALSDFARLDTNHDGKVTFAEFSARYGPIAGR